MNESKKTKSIVIILFNCIILVIIVGLTGGAMVSFNQYKTKQLYEYIDQQNTALQNYIDDHGFPIYSSGSAYSSCDDIDKNCIVFNSNNGDTNTMAGFPFQSSGLLMNYEEDGNALQIAYNTEEQTAKYRAKIQGGYQDWSDLAFSQEKLLEVSPVALPSCDLNDVIKQNRFYLLIDSNEYKNMPDESLKAGFIEVQYSNDWTLQTFYTLRDNRVWKRSFSGGEPQGNGWVLVSNNDDIARLCAQINDENKELYESSRTGSPIALPSCDLNEVIQQNKFYLLADSNKYEHLPDDSIAEGFLQVQCSGDWTMQIFYHTTDDRVWKRSFVGKEEKSGWKQINSEDITYEITQEINKDSIYNTYIISGQPTISADERGWLEAIDNEATPEDEATDMTGAIMLMLKTTGHCRLGPGTFYVSGNIDLPEGTTLEGCGNNTIIRLLPSVDSGYIVRVLQNNTVRGICFSGGKSAPIDLYADGSNYGSRHGIVFTGNADGNEEARSTALTNIITDCWFENFDGSGFYGHNTGGDQRNVVTMTDCFIDQCRIGINIDYFMEYSKFTNCNVDSCYYACINNGGNNVFTACTFHGVVCWMCDNSGRDKRNNTHGSCIGCTFNHANNMNWSDVGGKGAAIVILNADHGFVFSGCQLWYGNVIVDNSRAITFSDCLFGDTESVITVTGENWGTFFHNITFFNEPILKVNDKTIFDNCYTADGKLVGVDEDDEEDVQVGGNTRVPWQSGAKLKR